MLSSLKKFASGWIAQLLIGLLVLSFAVWGIADIFTGYGGNAVATVGKSEVTVAQYQRRYEGALRGLQQQFGVLSPQQAMQLGIPTRVLGGLVADATLDDVGLDMGLGISDDELSRKITTDPDLIGSSGIYSETYLRQLVANQNMTLDQFVVEQRSAYVRQQIVNAFAGAVDVPEAYLRAFREYSDEARTVEYVTVNPPHAFEIDLPSEPELEAFFEERKSDWRAPEYRAAKYMVLDSGAIAKPEDVTDQAARERYETQIARYTTPERRTLEQMVFDTAEEAEAAAAALSSGQAFREVAEGAGLSERDTEFGVFTRADLVDGPLGDAAFALELEGSSGVVEGRFGPTIVHVTAIEPGSVQPFEEVADAIKSEIALANAEDEINTLHDIIEDARAGGASLDEVAAQNGLELFDIAGVDATGQDENGDVIADLPTDQLVSSVFESDVGLENDPLRTAGTGGYVWYEVSAVRAPRDRALEEVRLDALTAFKDSKREEQAEADAASLLQRVEAGESLDVVAEDLGLELQIAEGVTRATGTNTGLSAAAVAAVFQGPEGHTASVEGAEPLQRTVLRVASVETPAFFSGTPDLEPVEQQLSRQITTGMIQLYINEAQAGRDVRFNQVLLDQIFSGAPAQGG